MSNYSSVCEIVEKYQNMSREVPYPKGITAMPTRKNFDSIYSFEMALSGWGNSRLKFLERKKEYNLAQVEITQAFKRDLLEYLEVSDHPKAERLWELAWDHGHSSGYGDVAIYAENFSELMK